MRQPGAILLVSGYDLGRQPASLAGALSLLEQAGFHPAALNLSVQRLERGALRRAKLVAIAAPMHTALRLGAQVAARARALNPGAHVVFFGLYATLNRAHLLEAHADSVVGDELAPLVSLARALEHGPLAGPLPGISTRAQLDDKAPQKAARGGPLPSRTRLPTLDRYARLEWKGESLLVASAEASRGCKHRCKHCPLVPVWSGRFVAVEREEVLADLGQQIEAGARHVSFADPDFFNGPTHALKLVRALHARWPALTFDATIKIEHLLAHRELLPELAANGGLFLTSALESLSDEVLRALDKGHTAAEAPLAVKLVREAGLELKPTLLPYTPWTKAGDLLDLFDFVEDQDLLAHLEPVQFTLRLLLPPGSLVVEANRGAPWLGPLVAHDFGHAWTHPDPRIDALQRASAELAAQHAHERREPSETFAALRALAEGALSGKELLDQARVRRPHEAGVPRPRKEVPRLTEPWFC